jgi:uncharacterized protein YcgI (DUF1989 family)
MAYDAGTEQGILPIDKEWYDKLVAQNSGWSVVEEFLLEPEGSKPPMKSMGRAVDVVAGQVLRVSQPGERGNILDLMFFNSDNVNEHNHLPTQFLHEGMMVRPLTRIWSGQPWSRPLATCIEDAQTSEYLPPGYTHMAFFAHCSSEVVEVAEGRLNASSCHSNFLQAAQEAGYGEEIAQHGNMVAFQPCSVRPTPDGSQIFGYADVPVQTKKGDYVDFYAERNLLVLVSLCPCGDQSASWKDVLLTPMKVQVLDTGTKPQVFKRFHDWRPYHSDMVAHKD